jgi:hypothetical protein
LPGDTLGRHGRYQTFIYAARLRLPARPPGHKVSEERTTRIGVNMPQAEGKFRTSL